MVETRNATVFLVYLLTDSCKRFYNFQKISQVGTRQAVNERLGTLLSHVAFPCSNFLAEVPSTFLEVAC